MLTSCIEERQTLSTFHELQREGREAAAPTAAEYERFLDTMRAVVRSNPNLSEARRASLLARIDVAATETIDGRTFYAANRVSQRAHRASTAMGRFYERTARAQGDTLADTTAAVNADMVAAHADRTLAAPREWVRDFAARPENLDMPMDRITAYAAHQAETRAAAVTAAAPTRPTVTHRAVSSSVVNTIGYDEATGHLEVELHRNPGVRYSYRIDPNTYANMMSGSVGSYWSRNIRSNPDYLYSAQDSATVAGTQTQCPTCGQFAAADHACPVRGSEQEIAATTRRAAAAVRAARGEAPTPPSAEIAQDLAAGRPAGHLNRNFGRGARRTYHGASGEFRSANLTDTRAHARQHGTTNILVGGRIHRVAGPDGEIVTTPLVGVVSGSVNVTYQGRGRGYAVTAVTTGENADRLQCTCPDYRTRYDCVHVRQTVQDVSNRINQSSLRTPHEIGESVAAVNAELARDRAESVQAQAAAVSNWGDPAASPVRYAEDHAAFQRDYKAAKDRLAAGEAPVPYMTENATDGLGARGTGRAFGVELEFDIAEGRNRAAALAAIGRDLHAAGLTSHSTQVGYHGSQRRGYTENHNGGWSYEQDCTVAGELVSPIMYDTPETWEKIAKATEIIKRHGGVASVRAGSHIHVSAGNYDHTVENHTRLLNSFQEHQDVLYRLSTNPERGTHRGRGYCTPNSAPSRSYRTPADAIPGNAHGMGLNMQSVRGHSSDHVEFRTWDSTLDPSVIQTQIKVSLAVTESAFRDRTRTPGPPETVGTHRAHNRAEHGATRRLTGDAWKADSASFRAFADQMFRRPEDKAQVAALFAVTKWQRQR
jgi:hypothetical protein